MKMLITNKNTHQQTIKNKNTTLKAKMYVVFKFLAKIKIFLIKKSEKLVQPRTIKLNQFKS